MVQYKEFAEIYDLLMSDVDYKVWVDYIIEIFSKNNLFPKKILDTACGTGNITIPLSRKGYLLYGVDNSEEMLAIAENKSRRSGQKIKFLNQDITKLNINEKFDAILCMCDGVNYILSDDELNNYFNKAFDILNENGALFFDISSYHKLAVTLGNNIIFEEKFGIYYVWENQFNNIDNILDMNIIFFVPCKGLYRKIEERHCQRAYKVEDLIRILYNIGFSKVYAYKAFTFEEYNEKHDRNFILAVK